MVKPWQSDDELFRLARQELFSAVVGDVMDKLGLMHQFLPPQIKPLRPDMVVLGRAMTVLEADFTAEELAENAKSGLANPFGVMLEALDDLKPNEVYLCSGSIAPYALWGELMTTRAIKLGASGVVMNGYMRDTHGILARNCPTCSHGAFAQDQWPRGKLVDYRVPLEINGTRVAPSCIVFGDLD